MRHVTAIQAMKFFKKFALPGYLWVILCAVYIVLVLNGPLWAGWIRVAANGGVPWFMASAALALIITAMISLALLPFSHPAAVKPVIIFVLVLSAVIHYFSVHFGIVVDWTMIENVVETNWAEASEFIDLALLRHVLVYAALPLMVCAFVGVQPVSTIRWLAQCAGASAVILVLVSVAVMTNFKVLSTGLRAHRELRLLVIPNYAAYSVYKYATLKSGASRNSGRPSAVAGEVRTAPVPGRKRIIVLMLGEAARSDHFSLNGYPRMTNPELMQQQVISFDNVWSCGTSTAQSLPCMFSDLTRAEFRRDRAALRENLLETLQRAGVQVYWIDNNSGSKGIADRVSFVDVRHAGSSKVNHSCGSNPCLDDVLVRELVTVIRKKDNNIFIVLHMLGQHGPRYDLREPDSFKRFLPECGKETVASCSRQELINAYDNALLYTDHVVAAVIKALETEHDQNDAVMLYISDHGESLGEFGIYLHGAPYWIAPDAQKHVPLIMWASDHSWQRLGIDRGCLGKNRHKRLTHDYLFDSILGLFTAGRSVRRHLDLFADCRKTNKSKK